MRDVYHLIISKILEYDRNAYYSNNPDNTPARIILGVKDYQDFCASIVGYKYIMSFDKTGQSLCGLKLTISRRERYIRILSRKLTYKRKNIYGRKLFGIWVENDNYERI